MNEAPPRKQCYCCDSCRCGLHSCLGCQEQSTSLEWDAHAASSAQGQQEHQEQQQQQQQQQPRNHQLDRLTQRTIEDQSPARENMKPETAQSPSIRCDCQTQCTDRYLASRAVGQLDGADQKERHLHVLVTRPQLGQPRDSVVFEGDVDLELTFEDSYEALARMRLDLWRKQRRLFGQGQGQQQQTPVATIRDTTTHNTPITTKYPGRERKRALAQPEAGSRETPVGGEATITQLPAESRASSLSSELMALERIESPADGVGLAGLARQGERPEGLGSPLETSAPKAEVVVAREASPLATPSEKLDQSVGGQGQSQAPAACGDQQPKPYALPPDTDPDLSPIIVYNANMNRLERVGLRKRSKYRPSTSLRSGARGLFGDSDPALVSTPLANK